METLELTVSSEDKKDQDRVDGLAVTGMLAAVRNFGEGLISAADVDAAILAAKQDQRAGWNNGPLPQDHQNS